MADPNRPQDYPPEPGQLGYWVPPSPPAPLYAAKPPDYLGWAIGSILLFWPVGIAAVIKSSQVDRFWAEGHLELARQTSATTRTLCLVATIAGAVCLVLGLAVFIWVVSQFNNLPILPIRY